ncbi:hypothetical protein DFH09DRAFT_1110397 [Mycena vulgaris]|nr:hypothetical protein DFH09DRAFT_1110397 [Mycena vulgaris]
MAKNKTVEKENEVPGTGLLNPGKAPRQRCRWNADCDALLIGQLLAEKAAGNQTDNAGWHQASFTACVTVLKGSEKRSGGAVKTADACLMRWSTNIRGLCS